MDLRRLTVGFYQLATRLPDVYEVQVPPNLKELLGYFRFTITLGFDDIATPLACLHLSGHHAKLVCCPLISNRRRPGGLLLLRRLCHRCCSALEGRWFESIVRRSFG